MRRIPAVLLLLVLVSCTSVIRKDLMTEGTRNPDLEALVRSPDLYRNRLFILGGVVARTTVGADGSQIEALYVPVDSYGNPGQMGKSARRYLAVYPRDKGVLDPLVYKKNMYITIAGTFTGTAKGTLDRMEYVFPVFTIVQIHLGTPVRQARAYYPPYPYWGSHSVATEFWWPYPGY